MSPVRVVALCALLGVLSSCSRGQPHQLRVTVRVLDSHGQPVLAAPVEVRDLVPPKCFVTGLQFSSKTIASGVTNPSGIYRVNAWTFGRVFSAYAKCPGSRGSMWEHRDLKRDSLPDEIDFTFTCPGSEARPDPPTSP